MSLSYSLFLILDFNHACISPQNRFDWCLENCPWNAAESDEECGKQSRMLRDFYGGVKPQVRLGVNFRDIPEAFAKHPDRVYQALEFLTNLPEVKYAICAYRNCTKMYCPLGKELCFNFKPSNLLLFMPQIIAFH